MPGSDKISDAHETGVNPMTNQDILGERLDGMAGAAAEAIPWLEGALGNIPLDNQSAEELSAVIAGIKDELGLRDEAVASLTGATGTDSVDADPALQGDLLDKRLETLVDGTETAIEWLAQALESDDVDYGSKIELAGIITGITSQLNKHNHAGLDLETDYDGMARVADAALPWLISIPDGFLLDGEEAAPLMEVIENITEGLATVEETKNADLTESDDEETLPHSTKHDALLVAALQIDGILRAVDEGNTGTDLAMARKEFTAAIDSLVVTGTVYQQGHYRRIRNESYDHNRNSVRGTGETTDGTEITTSPEVAGMLLGTLRFVRDQIEQHRNDAPGLAELVLPVMNAKMQTAENGGVAPDTSTELGRGFNQRHFNSNDGEE
jgi:hypothetical protein